MAQATGEHTVKSYDQELCDLTALVLRMGGLVEPVLLTYPRPLYASDRLACGYA